MKGEMEQVSTSMDAAADEDKQRDRFQIAVGNFIDLYKFIMVLAIGNCVRCLAQRQIQPNLNSPSGYNLKFETVSSIDILTFILVLMFISRFFLGDMAYWKTYCDRNKQIQLTDAVNLLVNSVLLTYLSFFIGYTHLVSYIMFVILGTEMIWGILRYIEGYFRATGALPKAVNAGLVLSTVTIVFVIALLAVGELPRSWPDGHQFTEKQNWIVLCVLLINNIVDLLINGARYLGVNDGHLLLSFRRSGE